MYIFSNRISSKFLVWLLAIVVVMNQLVPLPITYLNQGESITEVFAAEEESELSDSTKPASTLELIDDTLPLKGHSEDQGSMQSSDQGETDREYKQDILNSGEADGNSSSLPYLTTDPELEAKGELRLDGQVNTAGSNLGVSSPIAPMSGGVGDVQLTQVLFAHQPSKVDAVEILEQDVSLKTDVTMDIAVTKSVELENVTGISFSFQWYKDNQKVSDLITKTFGDLTWGEEEPATNHYSATLPIVLSIPEAKIGDTGSYTLEVVMTDTENTEAPDTTFRSQEPISLTVLGLGDAGYYNWLESTVFEDAYTTKYTTIQAVQGTDDLDIALLDLRGRQADLGGSPISIGSNVELIKIVGDAVTEYTNSHITVDGNTQVVMHNFKLNAPARKPAIEFKGHDPVLVTVGGPSGKPDFEPPVVESAINPHHINILRGGAKAASNLSIYGNADIYFSGHSGVIEADGMHGIDISNTLYVDLLHAVLHAIGGQGSAGVAAKPYDFFVSPIIPPLESGAKGYDAADSKPGNPGGDGYNGGHGIKVTNVNFRDNTSIYLSGGRGGDGATGGYGMDGWQGGPGAAGRDGAIGVSSELGGHGGNGGKGGNGGNGGNGGHGGSPLYLSGGNYAGFPPRSYLTLGFPGYGGVGGNGGKGGTGGEGGQGGKNFGKNERRAQGNGGNGGSGGDGGNGGLDGSYGSFDEETGYGGSSSFRVSGGLGGAAGSGGSGSNKGQAGSPGKEGDRRSNDPDTRLVPSKTIVGTHGPGFKEAVTAKSFYQPGEKMEITISATYGSNLENSPQNATWLLDYFYSICDNIFGGNPLPAKQHMIQLRHLGSTEPMEIVSVSEYMQLNEAGVNVGGYFTVTVLNPANTTDAPSRNDNIGVYFENNNLFERLGVTNSYENAVVLWTDEIRMVPGDTTLGRIVSDDSEEKLILYSLADTFRVNVTQWSKREISASGEGPSYEEKYPTYMDTVTAVLSYTYDNETIELTETIEAREEIVEYENETETVKYNEYLIEFDDLPDFSQFAEGDTVTLAVYPKDYDHPDNPNPAKLELPLHISHVLDPRLEMNPANQKVTAFTGDTAKIRFFSPAHTALMQQKEDGYEVKVWELEGTWQQMDDQWFAENNNSALYYPWALVNGDDTPAPFTPEMMEEPETPIEPIMKADWGASIYEIDTTELKLSDTMASPTEYLPKYLIQMTFTDKLGVTLGKDAYAYLAIRPRLLNVSLNKNPDGYVFLDDEGEVTFTWNLSGTEPECAVEVWRNGELLGENSVESEATYGDGSESNNIIGGKVTITLAELDETELLDEYQIVVTAKSGTLTRKDTTTFQVYNANALKILLEKGRVGNIDRISRLTSEEILDLKRVIDLTSPLRIDQSYEWLFYDLMTWESSDRNVVTLHTTHNDWWVELRDFPRSEFVPKSELLAVGHEQGEAEITVRHSRTDMQDTVTMEVEESLHDKLYLITASPAVRTEVTYTTGDGTPKKVYTNDKGQIAIYEPSGITGFVRFRTERTEGQGETQTVLYLGSVHASELQSGERSPATKQLYPMNYIALNRTSDQKFTAWLPNGQPYTGAVELKGGVYANGTLIQDSIFPETAQVQNGGSFTIKMDSTRYEDISIDDELKFVYEIIFRDGNLAPRLLTVDGYLQDDRTVDLDAITLNLVEWDGRGFVTAQHLYKNNINSIFDVTNHRTYIGMSTDHPTGELITNLAASKSTEAKNISFVEENGYVPGQQTLSFMNEGAPYLSGEYNYWQLQLTIDQNLNIRHRDARQYNIRIEDANSNISNINLDFQVANAIGLEKPKYSSGFDLSFTSVPGGLGDVMGAFDLNANAAIGAIMGAVSPVSVALPENIKFETMILQDDINPFLYHVMGMYGGGIGAALDMDIKSVSSENGGTDLKARYPSAIRTLRTMKKKAVSFFSEETAKAAAKPSGWLNNIKTGTDISLKANFNSSVEGFFSKEYTYSPKSNYWGERTTEFKVLVKLDTMKGIKVTIPTPLPAPIGSAIRIFIDYTQTFGLSVTVSGNTNGGRKLSDFILDVAADGSINLRGGFVGSIPLVGEADIGLNGLLELLARFKLDTYDEAEETIDGFGAIRGTIGIDANVRLGPSFLPLYEQYFQLVGPIVSPWIKIIGELPPELLNEEANTKSPAAVPLMANAAFSLLSSEALPEEWSDFPPDSAPVIVEKEDVEIAVWLCSTVPEDVLEEAETKIAEIKVKMDALLQEISQTEEGEDGAQKQKIASLRAELVEVMRLLQSYSEIIVSVCEDDVWTSALPLTHNLYPDMDPVVVFDGSKAVVLWQQIFEGQGENGKDVHELRYSVYDASDKKWGEVNNVDFSINGTVTSYDVAINAAGEIVITLVLDSASIDAEFIGITSVYAIRIFEGATEVYKLSTGESQNDENSNLVLSPKAIAVGEDFYLAYYLDDCQGSSDIEVRRITVDGLDNTFKVSLAKSLELYNLQASFDYLLVTDGSDVVLIWSAYNWDVAGDEIYAVKLMPNRNAFSSYITLLQAEEGYKAKVLSGEITASGVKASYIKSEYDAKITDSNVLTTGPKTFENDFIFGAVVNDSDIGIERDLPVRLVVINTGQSAITDLAVTLEEDQGDIGTGGSTQASDPHTEMWGGLNLLPGQKFDEYFQLTLGDTVRNMKYTVAATYAVVETEGSSENPVVSREAELKLAKPAIALSELKVLKAQDGIREFGLTLYNPSDVHLKGTDNTVRLTFYRDPNHTLPVSVTPIGLSELPQGGSIISITSTDLLGFIDADGLAMRIEYEISLDDLDEENNGEIFADGVKLFVKAEILGSDDEPLEGTYAAASAEVLFNSLLRHGQSSITTQVNHFDSSNGKVEVSLSNLSMKEFPLDGGRIVALLKDSSNKILSQKSIDLELDGPLAKEQKKSYTLEFNKSGGSDIALTYTTLSGAKALGALTLSDIPFTLSDYQGHETELEAYNLHNVGYTDLTAIASNPEAIITINGVRYADTANVTIPLDASDVAVRITVDDGTTQTTYNLNISTGEVAIFSLTIEAEEGGSIVRGLEGYYYSGEEIAIEAKENERMLFNAWTSSAGGSFADASSPATVFIMPKSSTTVTASFRNMPTGGYIPPVNQGGQKLSGSFPEGLEYRFDSGKALIFTVQKSFDLFREVRVDGDAITRETDYMAENSSTKITLFPEYLNTLSKGWHSLEVRFTDGAVATANFLISGEKLALPKGSEIEATPQEETNTAIVPPEEETNTTSPQPEVIDETLTKDTGIPFEDVFADDWFVDPVLWAYENGYILGTSTEPMLFSPHTPLSRGMVVTVLYRLADTAKEEPADNPFDDVTEDAWYAEAVKWAHQNGIVAGYGSGQFGPNDDITREQIASILHNYCQWKGMDLSINENKSIFSYQDASDISEWAIPSMQWASATGLFVGRAEGALDPKATATRAEFATVLMRFVEELSMR